MYNLQTIPLQHPVITLCTYKGLITKWKGSSSRDQKARIAGLLSPTLQPVFSTAFSKHSHCEGVCIYKNQDILCSTTLKW